MFGWLAGLAAKPLIASLIGRIKALWNWVFENTTHLLLALLALAVGFAVWQHFQLNTAREAESKAKSALEDCRTGRAADIQTWNERVAAAEALARHNQGLLNGAAKDAQTYRDQLASANQSFLDYKRTHRLPASGAFASGAMPGGAADAGGSAALPDGSPTGTFLAISEADLNTCDATFTYAAGAYQLMQNLLSKGLARPQH